MPVKFYDIFNGDADGICALHQLRLSQPHDSILVTGVKRDVGLLKKVRPGKDDQVTVLDVSLDANRGELLAMLERGGPLPRQIVTRKVLFCPLAINSGCSKTRSPKLSFLINP